MSSGGAERVISEMSNYWINKGWEISILTTNVTEGKEDFYLLDSKIKRIDISMSENFKKIKYFFNLLRGVRTEIKGVQPDIVISFISSLNIITIISILGLKIPLIISDRENPYSDKIGYLYKKIIYPFSSILVIQTYGVKKFYKSMLGLNIEVIPNPINRPFFDKTKKSFKFKNRTICAIGRFNLDEKGFDLLIEAFNTLAEKYLDWNLVIFGDGRDRDKLEDLIFKYGLKDRVFLPGKIDNPRNIVVDADIFVLSSLSEGFPNVLLEAMSVGLPPISFDCNYGPNEIIENGISGILVDRADTQELSNAIGRLIESKKLRDELGANAERRVVEHFYIDKVMKQWETLLDRILKCKIQK
jgi:glycosyltransferase involved in cell wall biosynthesis